jgi:thiol-disulfide isomerase/thioredoxin
MPRHTMTRRRFLESAALSMTALDTLAARTAASAWKQSPTNGLEPMPELAGATGWINSEPLTREGLRGKVVLADIWTYSCINSLRQLPYFKAWAARYKDAGLVVLGVHSPEFGFEKDRVNVERAVRDLNVSYPIAIDSNQGIWRAFKNEYWPADYFIDRKGNIRGHHFGEGDYEQSERMLQDLLNENGPSGLDRTLSNVRGAGIEARADLSNARSPETYVGYARAERFVSPERVAPNSPQLYSAPRRLELNEWALIGAWVIDGESASVRTASGRLLYRFHSRDLHFVLAPPSNGKPVHFTVRLDGAAPGDDHGVDTMPDGTGIIREPRLYQLIRQTGGVFDRTFEIEFHDAGARGFSLTFG